MGPRRPAHMPDYAAACLQALAVAGSDEKISPGVLLASDMTWIIVPPMMWMPGGPSRLLQVTDIR